MPTRRLALILTLVTPLFAAGADAAEITRLAVLSALGDQVSVVVHRPSLEGRIDRNEKESVSLPRAGLDRSAAESAAAAAAGAVPATIIDFTLGSVPPWTFEGTKFTPSAELEPLLAKSGASHLMLVMPARAQAALKLARQSVGSGYLEGAGFYVDREKRTRRSDTGEVGTGFLAPFAYFRVALVDLQSGGIVTDRRVTASTTLSAARGGDGTHPWEVLDTDQKIAALRRIIAAELNRVVPEMLR